MPATEPSLAIRNAIPTMLWAVMKVKKIASEKPVVGHKPQIRLSLRFCAGSAVEVIDSISSIPAML